MEGPQPPSPRPCGVGVGVPGGVLGRGRRAGGTAQLLLRGCAHTPSLEIAGLLLGRFSTKLTLESHVLPPPQGALQPHNKSPCLQTHTPAGLSPALPNPASSRNSVLISEAELPAPLLPCSSPLSASSASASLCELGLPHLIHECRDTPGPLQWDRLSACVPNFIHFLKCVC